MTPAKALASAMIDMMGGTQADGDEAAARILAALAAAGFVVVEKHTDDATAVAIAWCELQAEDPDCPDGRAEMFRTVRAMLAARPR